MVGVLDLRRGVRLGEGFCRDLSLSGRPSHVGRDERESFASFGRRDIGEMTFFGIKLTAFPFESEHSHFADDVAVLRVVRRVDVAPEVLGSDRDDLDDEHTEPEVESSVEICEEMRGQS